MSERKPEREAAVLTFELELSDGPSEQVGAFGLEVQQVLQVLEPGVTSPVPLAPALVLGIMTHHGRIITVVDPAPLLGVGSSELVTMETRVILLRQGQRSTGNVGLRVARVRQIVPAAELKPAGVAAGPCVDRVVQHERRLVHVVQVEPLLQVLANKVVQLEAREAHQGVA